MKLTVKQIKALQQKHGIENLLNPGTENAGKIANVDFLVDFYYEGCRSFQDPPTREMIEELDLRELLAAFEDYMNPKKPAGGND